MSIFVAGEPGERIEKTMSLSMAEFAKSLARVDADLSVATGGEGRYELALPTGRVVLEVRALEPMLMGGLVHLPRCNIVIQFYDTPGPQRTAFLDRFDQAFQRGGG